MKYQLRLALNLVVYIVNELILLYNFTSNFLYSQPIDVIFGKFYDPKFVTSAYQEIAGRKKIGEIIKIN
jgi:hypothetical protein